MLACQTDKDSILLSVGIPILNNQVLGAIRTTVVTFAFVFAKSLVILLVQVMPIAIEKNSWEHFVLFVVGDGIFVTLPYFF